MISLASAQVLNLIQATFVFGFNLSLSFISIPTIALSPSPILAVRQWNLQFERGRATATPLCVTSLMLSTLLAYATWPPVDGKTGTICIYYITSAILSFLVFPFTIYMINPINIRLAERANAEIELHYADRPEKTAGMQTMREHNDIARWGTLNWFRVATFGTVIGLNAAAMLDSL